MYGSVQAAFQHGITAPLRRPRRDPPAPELEQPQPQRQRIEGHDPLAGGDAPQQAPAHQAYDHRLNRNQVHRRRLNKAMNVENIGNANPAYSGDDTDAARPEAEQSVSAESDSENQRETQEGPAGATGSSVAAQTKTKPTESKSAQSKAKPSKVNESCSQNEPSREDAAPTSQPAESQPSQTDIEVIFFLNTLKQHHIYLTNTRL